MTILDVASRPATITTTMPVEELWLLKAQNERLLAKLKEKDRELAERMKELDGTTEKLRQLVAHSPAVIYRLRIEGQKVTPVFVSDNMQRLLGLSPDEVMNFEWWLKSLHPEDRERILISTLSGWANDGYTTEYRIRARDGSYRWVLDKSRVLRDASGMPLETIGVWTDITDRKETQRVLLEWERRFRDILENVQLVAMMLDSNGVITFCNDYLLQLTGWTREEVVGANWFSQFVPESDENIREMFFASIGSGTIPAHYEIPIKTRTGELRDIHWNNTMLRDTAGNTIGVASIGEDITERKRYEQSAARLQQGMESAIEALAGTLELRDAYTAGHQRRVAALAAAIARELGLSEDEIHGIHLAATIHDLGKIQVPAEILAKPTKLTKLEFELIKTHPQAGYDLLKDIDFPWPIAQLVYQHHERIDGSGYPRGLCGEETLIGARIIAVADTVEAICSHRPYRPGLGIEASLLVITKKRGTAYDPSVVDACLKIFREKRFTFSA
jgi:PAS domain S-box-containing protein